MPTADQYERAARLLDRCATEAFGLAGWVHTIDSSVMSGGRLTADVVALGTEALDRCDRVGEELRHLAAECRRRADQCRTAEAAASEHAAAMDAWSDTIADWTSELAPPPPPDPPRRPRWAQLR